ncbi:MAG: DUF115 domain-containing protein [Bacteroidales bacterium]|nr:DUF115 domain-containing protein [Bacteroidales bacterium]
MLNIFKYVYHLILDKPRIYFNRIAFKLFGNPKRNFEYLENLREQYQGKRCFIICNGPSLKAEDLTKIHENGDVSFACNKIDKIFPKTPWRPTFYTVADEGYQRSLLKTMQVVDSLCQFYRTDSYLTTRKIKDRKVIWLNTDGNKKYLDEPKFADNVTEKIYAIGTTTFMLMELAVHMGFKEIYITGCDNSYGINIQKDGSIVKTGQQSYFEGMDKKTQGLSAAVWQMNIAYECAKKYADSNGIKIFNATRGGHLEIFDRVDFDTLF